MPFLTLPTGLSPLREFPRFTRFASGPCEPVGLLLSRRPKRAKLQLAISAPQVRFPVDWTIPSPRCDPRAWPLVSTHAQSPHVLKRFAWFEIPGAFARIAGFLEFARILMQLTPQEGTAPHGATRPRHVRGQNPIDNSDRRAGAVLPLPPARRLHRRRRRHYPGPCWSQPYC